MGILYSSIPSSCSREHSLFTMIVHMSWTCGLHAEEISAQLDPMEGLGTSEARADRPLSTGPTKKAYIFTLLGEKGSTPKA